MNDSVYESPFINNRYIEKIIIEDGITSVSHMAFDGCKNLKSVVLPEGITYIGYSAFYNCINLKEINFPDSVKEIESYAFEDCYNLESVNIPDGITQIKSHTFSCCDSLDSIISIPDNMFCGCTKLETVNLPKNLTEIYFNAFRNCTSLKSISIPENVREIYQSAFIGCTALESIDLPKNIEYLGIDVFKDTPWLENKKAENPLVVVNNFVIDGSNCEGKVVIPEGTKYIAEEAFIENEKITEVVLPESLYYIGFNAFTGCSNLKEITIPSNVKEIADESIGFTYKETYEGVDILKNEGLVIKGYDGTAAHKYAARNGFEYVSLGKYESTYVFGDINLDGIIDANDASALLTYYALSSTGYNRVLESFIIENNPEFNYYMFYDAYEYGEFGDINGDEIIDANDASAVLSYYAQSSTDYEGTLEEFMKSMKA